MIRKNFDSEIQIKVPEGYAREGDFGFVYDKEGKRYRATIRFILKRDKPT